VPETAQTWAVRATFTQVMGGNASAVVVGPDSAGVPAPDELLAQAEARLRDLERKWTRFDTRSEMSQLAFANGSPVTVSADTRALVAAMADAWAMTGGLVDASVLPAVLTAGYTRSALDSGVVATAPKWAWVGADWRQVVIDEYAGTVMLPPGLAPDPGGIGKGLAADLVLAELLQAGATGALVEIGGDLRCGGEPPRADGWSIDVDHPMHDGALTNVTLQEGAVATSSTMKRRFLDRSGNPSHHLIGRDGRPADHGLATCTVVIGTGVLAETLAKVPMLAGEESGFAMLEQYEVPALVVRLDGTVRKTTGWGRVEP
jgi:thiamine biosynthesis lipoprotein